MNKTIRSGARSVIYKVFLRCLAEYEAGEVSFRVENVFQRTADLTGVSVNTVRTIEKEGGKNNGKFTTPGKHNKGRPKKELDNFDLCAIRQKVHFFYVVKHQVPTLRNLLPVVREDLGFDGSREHLRKVLRGLGFSYKKCQTDRSALMEKPNIAAKREKYLKIIMENRNLPEELQKNIIYLDEICIHSSYKLKKCWQSVVISGVKHNISKGKRYIIKHAGSEKGFVPYALLIFSGTNKNEDYHSEMNKTNFTKWVTEKLVPNLTEASTIVMDNAPYHFIVLNKAPSSATKVADIKLWLLQNNIPFEDSLRKPELLTLVKRHKPDPIYEIDEILGDHGHTVVRLPPYLCDLNPIELIWGIAKHKIAANNVGSIDIKAAAEQAFQSKNSCRHVMQIEKEYFERGETLYNKIDSLIINLRDDSSTDTNDTFESEDNIAESSNQDAVFSGIEYLDEDI